MFRASGSLRSPPNINIFASGNDLDFCEYYYGQVSNCGKKMIVQRVTKSKAVVGE